MVWALALLACAQVESLVPVSVHSLPRVGVGGRTALQLDPVHQIAVETPLGEPLIDPEEPVNAIDGTPRPWTALDPSPEGVYSGDDLRGGYLRLVFRLDEATPLLLQAAGHSVAYVNGELRAGDPYATGSVRLPFAGRSGENEVLLLCGRGEVRVQVAPVEPGLAWDPADPTLPDLVVGGAGTGPAGVLLRNASPEPSAPFVVTARLGEQARQTEVPPLAPWSVRKVAIELPPYEPSAAGPLTLRLESEGAPIGEWTLQAVEPSAVRKVTFRSAIDGSVQYYGLLPATQPRADRLILSLHGASVEASGQAAAYGPKPWANLVAPTNRRPFGFDWEDWGRKDALEVLALAEAAFEPEVVLLTGHSMGGHGTWAIGAQFAGRWAAVGPSAGWRSFWDYAGGASFPDDPLAAMLNRASNLSRIELVARNHLTHPVFLVTGDADDNVPPTESRAMRDFLIGLGHPNVRLHEEPGAGHWWDNDDAPGAACVDFPAMMELFRTAPAPAPLGPVDFTTISPRVSNRAQWVEIVAQEHPLLPSRVVGDLEALTTENVRRLALHLPREVRLSIDGTPVTSGPGVAAFEKGERWQAVAGFPSTEKGPHRSGPLREEIDHRFLLVYGTQGSPEENAWALQKARFDAETWWVRGNGAVDILPDTAFDPAEDPDRTVVLYGNAATHEDWEALLGASPIQVGPQGASLGTRTWEGGGVGALFLRPRPGSKVASVVAISGTGPRGMRATDRVPLFLSGAHLPDFLIFDSALPTQGAPALRAAGFFGLDWGHQSGTAEMR